MWYPSQRPAYQDYVPHGSSQPTYSRSPAHVSSMCGDGDSYAHCPRPHGTIVFQISSSVRSQSVVFHLVSPGLLSSNEDERERKRVKVVTYVRAQALQSMLLSSLLRQMCIERKKLLHPQSVVITAVFLFALRNADLNGRRRR